MARGDFTVFNEFVVSLAEKKVNLETDTIKLALITNGVTPAVDDATPYFGAGSGVDYDTNEVSAAGGYDAGGFIIPGPVFTRTGAVGKFDDDGTNIAMVQDAINGFTNAYWGILYSDTATNKECIGFLNLGGPISEAAGPISITWNTSGILTITRT